MITWLGQEKGVTDVQHGREPKTGEGIEVHNSAAVDRLSVKLSSDRAVNVLKIQLRISVLRIT